MELFSYYSLDECSDKKEVVKKLKSFKKDGKIEFNLDGDVFQIKDIELEEEEISELTSMFDELDVFPYLEREDEDEGDDYYDYGYDNEEDY